MNDQQLAIALRHFLLESKFIVLGISSLLFLGFPYFKISSSLYNEVITAKRANSLLKDFATTTGTINKIYQVKSYLPGRSATYVVEFSYLDRLAKVSTIDKNYLATNKLGDHVLVLYNKDAAVIEHIVPYFLPNARILTIGIAATSVLFLPLVISLIMLMLSLIKIKRIYTLHSNGVQVRAEITSFKSMRHNSYVVEYLYTPINSAVKLRRKGKAANYLQIGEQKPGALINILYDIKNPSITCVDEKNYE